MLPRYITLVQSTRPKNSGGLGKQQWQGGNKATTISPAIMS